MAKNKKTIRVCSCGTPMIWTFVYDGCERFCLNCGLSGGMFGTGDDVEATRELIFKKKIVDAIWKVIYANKGLCPVSCQRKGCKKCSGSDERHYEHLTKAEKEWDEIARKTLEQMKGLFD